jgi:hypothetical protein
MICPLRSDSHNERSATSFSKHSAVAGTGMAIPFSQACARRRPAAHRRSTRSRNALSSTLWICALLHWLHWTFFAEFPRPGCPGDHPKRRCWGCWDVIVHGLGRRLRTGIDASGYRDFDHRFPRHRWHESFRLCRVTDDKAPGAEYGTGPYVGFAGQVLKGFAPIVPSDADVSAVVDAIVKVVDAPLASVFWVYVDPKRDDVEVVNPVSNRILVELLRRSGFGHLLILRHSAEQR